MERQFADHEVDAIIVDIVLEMERAERKHPHWPKDDILRQAVIIMEEAGETVKAGLELVERLDFEREHIDNEAEAISAFEQRLDTEAVHTAAMALRFLLNWRRRGRGR